MDATAPAGVAMLQGRSDVVAVAAEEPQSPGARQDLRGGPSTKSMVLPKARLDRLPDVKRSQSGPVLPTLSSSVPTTNKGVLRSRSPASKPDRRKGRRDKSARLPKVTGARALVPSASAASVSSVNSNSSGGKSPQAAVVTPAQDPAPEPELSVSAMAAELDATTTVADTPDVRREGSQPRPCAPKHAAPTISSPKIKGAAAVTATGSSVVMHAAPTPGSVVITQTGNQISPSVAAVATTTPSVSLPSGNPSAGSVDPASASSACTVLEPLPSPVERPHTVEPSPRHTVPHVAIDIPTTDLLPVWPGGEREPQSRRRSTATRVRRRSTIARQQQQGHPAQQQHLHLGTPTTSGNTRRASTVGPLRGTVTSTKAKDGSVHLRVGTNSSSTVPGISVEVGDVPTADAAARGNASAIGTKRRSVINEAPRISPRRAALGEFERASALADPQILVDYLMSAMQTIQAQEAAIASLQAQMRVLSDAPASIMHTGGSGAGSTGGSGGSSGAGVPGNGKRRASSLAPRRASHAAAGSSLVSSATTAALEDRIAMLTTRMNRMEEEMWMVDQLSEDRCVQAHEGAVFAMIVVQGVVITGGYDGSIKLWEPATWLCRATLKGHGKYVSSLAHIGRFLLSGSADHMIRVWDMRTFECVHVFRGHEDGVQALAVWRNRLFSSGMDMSIRCWDLDLRRQALAPVRGHKGVVSGLCCTRNLLISCSGDKTIRVWNASSLDPVSTLRGHTDSVRDVKAFQTTLVSGSYDGSIMVWSLINFQHLQTLRADDSGVVSLCITPRLLLAGTYSGRVLSWDTQYWQEQCRVSGHRGTVFAICTLGKAVLSCAGDYTVRKWIDASSTTS